MIEIKQLTKTYRSDIHALQAVDLTIGTGMFGLLGPNGAGKTTLMRILAGLLRPSSGEVHVFGNDLATANGKRNTKAILGYLPQELGLYPNLTGYEFLDYVGVLKGITDSKTRKDQIHELIDLLHVNDVIHRRLKTYSGGMKRRIGIAQALLGKPQLLIVDEPTVGLDPEERVRLRNLFADIARNCAVILSTHIVDDISQSCKELAVMHNGRVLYGGSPKELINEARGKVWNVLSTDGQRPNGGLEIVSTLQLQDGTQYRVIGQPTGYTNATAVEPSLEDGYMWLMRQSRAVA